jgi:hypothetical protein
MALDSFFNVLTPVGWFRRLEISLLKVAILG